METNFPDTIKMPVNKAKGWFLCPPGIGYETEPAYDEIAKMPREALQSVFGFVIKNEHGSISFLTPIDLVDVDLGKDVVITCQSVEVYPDYAPNPTVKP